LGEGEREEEEKEEDYSTNMAQNQLNDKPTFSEAKMLYQTTTMETQYFGYYLLYVEYLPLPNAKIVPTFKIPYHTKQHSTAQHT